MRKDMPMKERIDRVGELLAKAVYLYAKKEEKRSSDNNCRRDSNLPKHL